MRTGDWDCAPAIDAAAWAHRDEAKTVEAERIVECGLLIGWPQADVEAKLGRPSERHEDGLGYELGPDWLSIDSMYLDVIIRDGRVVGGEVSQG